MKYLPCLLIILFMSCNCYKGKSQSNSEQQTPELTLLMSDPYGGEQQQDILLIENQKALKAFFAKVNRTRKSGLPVPEVDFEKDMVIIYFSGQTTQQEIPLLAVEELQDEKLLLSVNDQEALKEGNTNTALLHPFGLYSMARTDKKVVLKKQ